MLDTYAKKTVTQTNLQALIAEIDSFLTASTLPEPEQQRQILQKVKSYLISIEQNHPVYLTSEIAQQISQSVITSVNSNLGQSFEKLQQELDGFYQHRNFLLQEIEELETKQQQIISELTDTLERQINQIKTLEVSLQENNQENTSDKILNLLKLQETVDKFIVNFDATFRTVFETLEKDLQEYKKSLSQGLEQIYDLTQREQGKVVEKANIQDDLSIKKTVLEEVLLDQPEIPPQIPILPEEIKEEKITKPTILEEKKFYNLPISKINKKQILNPDIEIIKALTDIIDPEAHFQETTVKEMWYLGIDFGTFGMAAVLFHARLQGYQWTPLQQCPIYWSYKLDNQFNSTFRLPTAVYSRNPSSPFCLGILAEEGEKEKGFVLENFKPYLDIVPLVDQEWFPWKSAFDRGEEIISLAWVQQAIEELLGTLNPAKVKDRAESELYDLTIGAIGLNQEILTNALDNLSGIVFSCPVNWSDTYRFNLRESLLRTGLVKDAGKIFFLEEPIANLLAHLPINPEADKNISTTLVINAGYTKTELLLTELPENPQQISHGDMNLISWNYGDQSLNQDILCHLLYSNWMSQLHPSLANLELELPEVGEVEIEKRQRLELYLENNPLGKSLLQAAENIKIILQDNEEFTPQIGLEQWTIKRQDLEGKITLIVLDKLFERIEQLLKLANKSTAEVGEIICSGKMSVGLGVMLLDYLKGKFPNAVLIQDGEEDNNLSVAMGLSRLPLFPMILDRPKHQYSDYFLLLEILTSLPRKPFTFEEMLRILQRRGINTRVCSDRIFSILEGNLPMKTELTPFTKGENDCYDPDQEQCEELRQYFQHLLPNTQQTLTEPLVANLS